MTLAFLKENWQMSSVFISYVSEDRTRVQQLQADLVKEGCATFFDRDSLMVGENWPETLNTAIRNSDFFIACFSKQYWKRVGKTYMEDEIAIAIEKHGKDITQKRWILRGWTSPAERHGSFIEANIFRRSVPTQRLRRAPIEAGRFRHSD